MLAALRPYYPYLVPAQSVLETGLYNGNPVLHPAIALLNAGALERNDGTFRFYGDGMTPAVARLIEAVDGERRGLVDHWLHPIRETYAEHRCELEAMTDERARLDRLVELNVIRQVKNVASDVFVQDAWARGQPLCVHGWVYSISNGLVTDLNVAVGDPGQLEALKV